MDEQPPPLAEADEAPSPTWRRRPVIVSVFLLFWLIWLVGLGFLRGHHPGLDHGDPTTDANILNGGDNFARDGVRSSFGVPAIDTYRADGHTPDRYVTYPPGGYWFHHVVRSLGVGSMGGFRVVSITVSGLAVLLMFATLSQVCRDAAPAAIACALYMLSKPFVEYADALHYLSLSQFTLMLALYAWVRSDDAADEGLRSAAIAWFALSIAATIADSFLTFEHAIFIAAFAAMRAVSMRRWRRLVGAAMLLAVPALVLAIRLLLNRAVLGSFGAVIAVMRGKFDQRVGSAAGGTGVAALIDAWLPRLGWTAGGSSLPGDHPDAEFGLPVLGLWCLLPLALLTMLAIAHWHYRGFSPVRRLLGLGAMLLLGGLTWFAFMTEHALSHRFTVLLLLPGLAAIVGGLIAAGLAQPELHHAAVRGRPRAIVRLVGPLLGVAAFAAWCAPLRSSFAVNTIMRADNTVREAVHRRSHALEAFAAASQHLSNIQHLLMLSYDAPAARALSRPFDNSLARRVAELPTSLSAEQAVLAPLWTPDARAASIKLAGTVGLPTMLSATLPPYLLFSADDTPDPRHVQSSLHSSSGLVIDQVSWRRTIDQHGWVLVVLAHGPVDALASTNARFVVRGEIYPGQWSPIGAASIGAALRDGDQILLVVTVEDAAIADIRSVELRLVSDKRPRVATWSVPTGHDPASLPVGLHIIDGSLRWPQPPWRARPAQGALER